MPNPVRVISVFCLQGQVLCLGLHHSAWPSLALLHFSSISSLAFHYRGSLRAWGQLVCFSSEDVAIKCDTLFLSFS